MMTGPNPLTGLDQCCQIAWEIWPNLATLDSTRPHCSGADVRPLGPSGRSQRLEELVRAEAWGLGVCVNKGKRCGCVVV